MSAGGAEASDEPQEVKPLSSATLKRLVAEYAAEEVIAGSLAESIATLTANANASANRRVEIRRQLADHTLLTGTAAAVRCGQNRICIIPVASRGYSKPEVYPSFHEILK